MKLGIIVGTRPEIVKMAPVVRACRRKRVPFVFIHTGQHYSYELDGVFFDELKLPRPDHNLSVGSGTHPQQIAAMVRGLELVFNAERPDMVLVEGDTNTVLAAGLTANKLAIPVGHIEAGLRSYDRRMPEEMNRIVIDHLSDLLFAPTEQCRKILLKEGIPPERIFVTGNTVVDELILQKPRALKAVDFNILGVAPRGYAIATVHRPENTENEKRLGAIFAGLRAAAKSLNLPILMPLHPRTRKRVESLGWRLDKEIRALPPQGYLEFLGLQANASIIFTDSGGVQEEACCLRVPCVTLRDSTERPESIDVGANVLAGADAKKIAACARKMIFIKRDWRNPFGKGDSAERIIKIAANYLKTR
ncbi:MAG: UDP-N-acetylglucosamine 2-epimerase (non-hydrolyzing) [Planctomycetes bacterium]|nr:UDP-N-acetylglucosamine 2-epimerase (non-hydrolyzing) [Planctomycetota bacterium]